jgi:aconitate hydratase
MGILPLEFREGETRKTLGLDGTEKVDILVSQDTMDARDLIDTRFIKPDGEFVSAQLICRLDTNSELAWFKAGGVMPHILNKFKTT